MCNVYTTLITHGHCSWYCLVSYSEYGCQVLQTLPGIEKPLLTDMVHEIEHSLPYIVVQIDESSNLLCSRGYANFWGNVSEDGYAYR